MEIPLCTFCDRESTALPGLLEVPVCRKHHPFRYQLWLQRLIRRYVMFWSTRPLTCLHWTKFQRYIMTVPAPASPS